MLTPPSAVQVLKFAQDLGLEELDVKECGCLGRYKYAAGIAEFPFCVTESTHPPAVLPCIAALTAECGS